MKLASSFALCCISVNTDILEGRTDHERSEPDIIADVREQPLNAAGSCCNDAAVPHHSPLGKYEKMGSRPKACGFSNIYTEG